MTPLVLLLLMSAPSEQSIREAELRAAKALALWETKSYVGAAEYFIEAFELSGEPTQLRNAAKAYEAGNAKKEARATWTRYLALPELTAADRAEAEQRLRALAVVEQPRTLAPIAPITPVAVVVEAVPEIEEPVRWEPWVLTAAGAIAAAVGGVLLYRSERDLDQLKHRLSFMQDGRIYGISYDEAIAEEQRIEAWRIGSSTVVGIGIAAVIGGLSWWWLE